MKPIGVRGGDLREIYKRAAGAKGGENAVELMLQPVKRIQITKVSDADAGKRQVRVRFALSEIIEAKPDSKTAFSDFDVMQYRTCRRRSGSTAG